MEENLIMLQRIGVLLLLATLVVSCATHDQFSRGQVGLATGGALGALIGQAVGGDTGSTLAGLAIGGVLGYIVGNEMDKADQARVARTMEYTPSYQSTSWVNPDTGRHYSVTPQPAYVVQDPRYAEKRVCRDAEIQAVIDGRLETVRTTACRTPTGEWVLQN